MTLSQCNLLLYIYIYIYIYILLNKTFIYIYLYSKLYSEIPIGSNEVLFFRIISLYQELRCTDFHVILIILYNLFIINCSLLQYLFIKKYKIVNNFKFDIIFPIIYL